jgi:hypothetical protein
VSTVMSFVGCGPRAGPRYPPISRWKRCILTSILGLVLVEIGRGSYPFPRILKPGIWMDPVFIWWVTIELRVLVPLSTQTESSGRWNWQLDAWIESSRTREVY